MTTTSPQRVVIVGAGVVGACCALALARRGAAVTVVDKGRTAGACSFGNSGIVAPGHEPLSAPGVDRRALDGTGDPAAALRVRPEDREALAPWLDRFARACTPHAYQHAMDALFTLAPHILPLFDALIREHAVDCGYQQTGTHDAAFSDEPMRRLRAYADEMRARGLPAELLSADKMRRREPRLDNPRAASLVGGLYLPMCATLEPYRFTTAIADAARAAGATFIEQRAVEAIEHRSGRVAGVRLSGGEALDADAAVLATGADLGPLLEPFAVDTPMAAAVGWHLDVEPAGEPPAVRALTIMDRDVILTPMGNRVRVSGLVEIASTPPREVDPRRIAQLREGAEAYLGPIEGKVVSEWVGRRPALPDGLPAIGPTRGLDGLHVAAGHARMGLTLGPATGEMIARSVLGEAPLVDPAPFDPDRFATSASPA